VSLIAPGVYSVTIEREGFRRFEQAGINLDVNQVYVADARLEVGNTSQVITVEANTAQINTTQMQLGTTVTGSSIVDLPLNGRDWIQLQQLQPGVESASDRLGNYSTNGAETQQNAFFVNGVDTADISLNTPGAIPSPDAIGEFHMVTSTINPEYGRNSGAIMNAVIKNGTNQLHGGGFEFYRDTFLDARNFFLPTTSPFHQNEFGGTIGGPIVFPHVYNGRNKSFFFFSYQGWRNVAPQAFSLPTVYSNAERGGNFSDVGGFPSANSATGATPISAFPLMGDDGTTYPAGSQYSTIFAKGYIPTADLNPLALKVMNQFVPPSNYTANQYTFAPSNVGSDDQIISRYDQNFGSKDAVWAYTFYERNPVTSTLPFAGASLPGFTQTNQLHIQQYAISWNHTFSPTTLNEARFGYFRFNYNAVNPASIINPTSYGFTGINPQFPSNASLPVMSVVGMFSVGFSIYGPQPRLENTYQFIDNFSKIAGKHTLKAGFTTDRFQCYNPFELFNSGYYSYAGTGPFSTGVPGADFLLGVPDLFVQSNGSVIDTRAKEYYSYFQDEFKVRPNLTLTFGTGWDIETPYTNLYYGREMVNAFRPGQQSTVFPTAPTGVLWPGDTGITDTGGVKTHYHDLSPRFGFAWSPGSSKTWSVHGGFGIYFNRTEEEIALQNLTTPPFAIDAYGALDVGGSPAFANPWTGWCAPGQSCTAANLFPYTAPLAGSTNVSFVTPLTINTLSQNFVAPYSENYNLTIERQIGSSMTLTAAYVGNTARHLEGNVETNPAGLPDGTNPVAAAAGCTASNLGTCAPTTFRYNPVATGLGAIDEQVTEFNSRYNSFQFSVNKRMSHGLQFLAAYTWARFFDQNSTPDLQDGINQPGIDPFSYANMWGPSDNDAPQRFVFSYSYTLPFYHFVPHARKLVDGWRLTGITTFQSGFPIIVANSADPSDTCWGAIEVDDVPCWDRPNRVQGVSTAHGNARTWTIGGQPNYWFNPAAFAPAPPGTGIGNSSRTPLYGPGINNFDIALYKEIHFTEAKYIQLRLESYNTFNHTQFSPSSVQNSGGVVSDINDPRFGRVISAINGRVVQLAAKIYF